MDIQGQDNVNIFETEEYKELSVEEQRDIAIEEFQKCKQSFEYYLKHYAYIRHPNCGIIKFDVFDFQYDVAIPISNALKYGRTEKAIKENRKYKRKFDYEKWIEKLMDNYKEEYERIPPDLHDYYNIIVNNPSYDDNFDTILLKSRQTGLSTIFEHLQVWHCNFYANIYDMTLSQDDRSAKKFLTDVKTAYTLLPPQIKSKKVKDNEHELWLSISGDADAQSIIQTFPPTEGAGRSYSPNLIILDEFAFYRQPMRVWSALSMTASAGGIFVIISTPNGIGNLYHLIWEMSKKKYMSSFDGKKIFESTGKNENIGPDVSNDGLFFFKPVVVHWTQLPIEEFERRGFQRPIDWYNYMSSKLSIEGGQQKVAQELDLDFTSSGETIIAGAIIKEFSERTLEKIKKPFVLDELINGLVIYEKFLPGETYICGVDVGEGVGKDYSVIYVMKFPNNKDTFLPQVVATYKTNTKTPRQFASIVKLTGKLYNNAFLNIERNNHGHVLLSYLIEDDNYDSNRILNTFSVTEGKFLKTKKGWATSQPSRQYLLSNFVDYVLTYKDDLYFPSSFISELKTFVANKSGKYEALPGYNDDEIMAFLLAFIGCKLLQKFKQFLQLIGEATSEEIPDDLMIFSSSIGSSSQNIKIENDETKNLNHKMSHLDEESRLEELRREISLVSGNKKERNMTYNFISHIEPVDDDFDDIF